MTVEPIVGRHGGDYAYGLNACGSDFVRCRLVLVLKAPNAKLRKKTATTKRSTNGSPVRPTGRTASVFVASMLSRRSERLFSRCLRKVLSCVTTSDTKASQPFLCAHHNRFFTAGSRMRPRNDYHKSTVSPVTCWKCRSAVASGRSDCSAMAAIQMSFCGMEAPA
jgi:hypothetical protein